MNPRTLDQIYKELDASYNPSIQALQKQQEQLPSYFQAQEQGLNAQKDQAFGDIQSGAQQRGVGFSGLPIAEQAKYTGGTFLPAVAGLKKSQNDAQSSIVDAMNNINLDRTKTANSLYTTDQANYRDYQLKQEQLAQERAAAQAAAAAAAAQQSSLAGILGGSTQKATTAQNTPAGVIKKPDGGHAFTDQNGNPVSAAVFAQLKGIPFRTLLEDLAKNGDAGAKQALGFVGNDFGYNPGAIGGNGDLYNSLVWGTGRQFSGGYSQPVLPRGLAPASQSKLGVPNGLVFR